MKNFFLLTFFSLFSLSSFSQSSLTISKMPSANLKSVPFAKGQDNCSNQTGPSTGSFLNFNTTPAKTRSGEIVIGNTTYDNLPSNQRLFPGASGKLSASWTGSTWIGAVTASNPWPDRGTFTNFFDGSSWGPIPTVRIESIRAGFPANVILGNGSEWNFSHVPVDTLLDILNRPVAGTGAWTETVPSGLEVMWPHATAWNNYIHVIGSDNKAPANNYMQYSRSSNGGVSWDIQNMVLPQIDTANCFNIMSAESYAIDARNHTVAVIAGGSSNSVYLWKSTDDGSNWTRSTIWNFALCGMDGYQITDVNMDGIVDTLETSDGSYAIIIDNNNLVHTWFGYTRVIDTDTTQATGSGWNYYPGWNALMYWNESFGADSFQIIGRAPDMDGDSSLAGIGADLPNYGCSLASMATVAMDTTNNIIFCVFTAPIENTDLFGDPTNASAQSFRDLFGTYSTDNGLTWSTQSNLTNTATTYTENAFPSASKYTRNGKVDVMWMRDGDPSTSLDNSQGTADAVQPNDIVFNSFGLNNFDGVKTIDQNVQSVNIYPNPTSDIICLNLNGFTALKGSITMVNLLGQTVKSFSNITLNRTMKIDASDLTEGIYFVTVKTSEQSLTQKVIIAQ